MSAGGNEAGKALRRGPLRLGFGCSGAWGKKWFSEEKAHAVLRAAIDGGVTHIDTAGFYDEAETRLGAMCRDLPPESLFISTKTGRPPEEGAKKDFSLVAVTADVEASLKRLGRERLDLLYLHGPNITEIRAAAEIIERLKADGKIAMAGVCGEGPFLAEAARAPFIDVVMGAFNLFHRDHEETFRLAKEAGKGVVAIAPLAQGHFRRDFFRPKSLSDGWHLARALVKNRPELKRVRAARDALEKPGWSPAGLALAFVLAHPHIDIAVTTTTKTAHLRETLTAAAAPPPAETLARLTAEVLDGDGAGA